MTGGEAERRPTPILDAHIHIWDIRRQRLPWLSGTDGRLTRTWTLDELAKAYRSFNDAHPGTPVDLTGSVYVEVDCDDPLSEDRLIGGDADPRIRARIMRSQVSPVTRVPVFAAGIREPLHTEQAPRGRCLEPKFIAGLNALGRRDLAFDACVRIGELDDFVSAARHAPRTTIVLDHMGNVDGRGTFTPAYRNAMRRLGALPNVYVKVSGYPTEDRSFVADLLEFIRDAFPADRLLYASNWPVIGLYGSLDDHIGMLLDEFGDDDGFWRGNAMRAYRIGPSAEGDPPSSKPATSKPATFDETNGSNETTKRANHEH